MIPSQKKRFSLLFNEEYSNNRIIQNYDRIHVPLGSECELCGLTKNLERAHSDYTKNRIIATLCGKCHKWIDLPEHYRNYLLKKISEGHITITKQWLICK